MRPDFGKTAADYSRHRQGFPNQLFEMLSELEVIVPGARAVDLGTGTGSLARGLARRGATVTGVDPSTALTEEAHRLDLEWGVSTQYLNSTAEKTGLESDAYDIVASGQSWWWFDRQQALAEARRILRLGGKLVICSFDWVPIKGSAVEMTEQLIKKHNPDWNMDGGTGAHPDFLEDLEAGGFTNLKSGFHHLDALYTRDAWRGRVRASAGIGASLNDQQIQEFDRELANALNKLDSTDPLALPHALFAAVGSVATE